MPRYLHEGGVGNCGGPICLRILAARQASDKEGLDRLFNSDAIFPKPSIGTDVDGKGANEINDNKKKEENSKQGSKEKLEDSDRNLEKNAIKPEASKEMNEKGAGDKNNAEENEEKTKQPMTKPAYAACWATDKGNAVPNQIKQWWNSTEGCQGKVTIPELGHFCVPSAKLAEWAFPLAVCRVTPGNDKINAMLDRLFNSGEIFTTPLSSCSSGTTPQYADCWSTDSTFPREQDNFRGASYFLSNESLYYEENKKKDIKRSLEQELIEQGIGKTIAAHKDFSRNINRAEVKLAKAVLKPMCGSNTICQAGRSFLDSLGTITTMTSSIEAFMNGKYSRESTEKIAEMERRKQHFERAQKSPPYIFESDSRFREHHQREGEAVQRDEIKKDAWAKRGLSERIRQKRQDSSVSYNEAVPPMKHSPELYKDTPHIYRNLPKLLQEPSCELLFMAGSLYASRIGPVGIAATLGIKYARDKSIEVMNNRVDNDEKHNVLVDHSRAAAIYIALDRMQREQQKSRQASELATESLKQSMSSIPEASAGSEVTPLKMVRDTIGPSFSSSPPQEQCNPTGARP